MAFIQYLNINGEDIPMPTSYSLELEDVEAESSGETEAGTTQRDVIRSGVVNIAVSFLLSSKWLKKMSEYRRQARLRVKYFDTEKLQLAETEMFIEKFKAELEKDTKAKSLWKVSFSLREF